MATDILIFGMNYAPEFAGVGRYTGEIAEYLATDGVGVTVVTTPPHYPDWRVKPPFKNRAYTTERLNNVKVIRCPLWLPAKMGGVWRLIAPLTFSLAAAPVLYWQILRHRPKIVVSIVPTMLGVPFVVAGAKLVGAKLVLHVQDLEVDAAFAVGHLGDYGWLKAIGAWFERWAFRRFEIVVTISDKMAEKLVEKGVSPDKIAVVRNWVDLDVIRPLEAESGYRRELGLQGKFVVLYSGAVGRKQGLHVLLGAAERLGSDDRIVFVVAGEGPAKSDLIARYGYLANARFLPFQPAERLSEFLGGADLHVLPQDSNVADLVLPSKLGFMLASGKPMVVMTDEGTEMMNFLGDAATIARPGDSEGLAAAILASAGDSGAGARRLPERLRLAMSLSKREGLLKFAKATVGSVGGQVPRPV